MSGEGANLDMAGVWKRKESVGHMRDISMNVAKKGWLGFVSETRGSEVRLRPSSTSLNVSTAAIRRFRIPVSGCYDSGSGSGSKYACLHESGGSR